MLPLTTCLFFPVIFSETKFAIVFIARHFNKRFLTIISLIIFSKHGRHGRMNSRWLLGNGGKNDEEKYAICYLHFFSQRSNTIHLPLLMFNFVDLFDG
jgi:hypothetical protein